jgi:hypothetical protein
MKGPRSEPQVWAAQPLRCPGSAIWFRLCSLFFLFLLHHATGSLTRSCHDLEMEDGFDVLGHLLSCGGQHHRHTCHHRAGREVRERYMQLVTDFLDG